MLLRLGEEEKRDGLLPGTVPNNLAGFEDCAGGQQKEESGGDGGLGRQESATSAPLEKIPI